MDDIGEHGAGGLHVERSGTGIFKEGGIEAVVDGGSDHNVFWSGGKDALLEVFGHEEVVVELEMAAVLFGLGAESDDDDGAGSEDVFGFVPGEIFEKNGGVRGRGWGRIRFRLCVQPAYSGD
jgi:hypothetical protein